MLLAIDVGNSNVTIGAFDGERLCHRWRLATPRRATVDDWDAWLTGLLELAGLDRSAVTAFAVACVVPALTPALTATGSERFGCRPVVAGHECRTGLRLVYDDPAMLGVDRLLNAVAAHQVHLAGPATRQVDITTSAAREVDTAATGVIVLDFGTATKAEVVTADGRYLGGAISPGVLLAAEGLRRRTARLPAIHLHPPLRTIGTNTVDCMLSGVVVGFAGLVDRLVDRLEAEAGIRARVVATGGLAGVVAPLSERIDLIDPTLTLTGLRLVHDMNLE